MGRISLTPNVRKLLALVVLLAGGSWGCGYSLRPPYNAYIHTVYVPVFKTNTFRRDLNLQLTELVIKEIEKRTPYKVVGTPEGADSTLDGEVTFTDKNLMVENPNNLARQYAALLTVSVKWVDNRPGVVKKDILPTVFSEQTNGYPEIGETALAVFTKVTTKLARDIVNTMEEPWSVRDEKPPVLFEAPDPNEVLP